jgi:carboxypeptidase PM20D1
MRFAGKLATGLAVAALGVGSMVAWRTGQFTPSGLIDTSAITFAAVPPYDLERAIGNLGAAVRFQTVSHQDPDENRIEEWRKLQAWLQSTYPAAHKAMKREVLSSGTLVYEWTGSDPKLPAIIVMAHQDVVPVTAGTEKDWKYPPFAGEIAESAVWGRGTVDDKGALIGLFEALDALARSGFTPKRTVYLVSGHDEEVGGTGATAAAALLAARNVKALFTIDEGSAVILDAPVINGPAIMIGIAEKGYATLQLTAKAAGGHSSMPPKDTGVVNLAKAILAIHSKPFPLELRGPGADSIASLGAQKGGFARVAMANGWLFGSMVKKQAASTPSGAALFHTTIAPTMLQGSPKENVLPQSASALINYRIAPWNSSADVMARAKSAVGKLPVELSWVKPPREPSRVSSTTSQGWKLVAAAARVDAPDAALAPYLVVGGTDSRKFEGISADVYRFMPMHFTIKSATMIHGTNEHMTTDSLRRMIDFYARLIATSAG